MTAVASVAAVAAAARVFVFSRAFLRVLGFSQVFFGLIELSRISCSFGDLSGCLWVAPLRLPESLRVPLGSPWCALGPPFGRCGSLWHPLGVALGWLWGTSGVSLVALGSLGLPGGVHRC